MSVVALKVEDLPHYTYDDYIQWDWDSPVFPFNSPDAHYNLKLLGEK